MSVFRLKPSKKTIEKNKLKKLNELKENMDRKERQLMWQIDPEKTEADYSKRTRRRKMVQTQMIQFLKSKLRGNTDQEEIDYIKYAILKAEIDIITIDIDSIRDEIRDYEYDEEEETLSGGWVNYGPQIFDLTELVRNKYMPILEKNLAALIKKYPEDQTYINNKVRKITNYFK